MIRREREALRIFYEMAKANKEEGKRYDLNEARAVFKTIGADAESVKILTVSAHEEDPYKLTALFSYKNGVFTVSNFDRLKIFSENALHFYNSKNEEVSASEFYKVREFENPLKELEFSKPKIMKHLNFIFGYDFQKPYTVAEIEPPFTVGKIKKALGIDIDGKRGISMGVAGSIESVNREIICWPCRFRIWLSSARRTRGRWT